MIKFKGLGLSIVAATILFTGCATTELQTNAKMTQSVFINPVKKELRTVFISTKNTSGQKINLEHTIISELQAKGYKVVDDPDAATYVLLTNVLYCDKKQENNAGAGALGAGAVGAGVAGYNNSGAGGTIAAGLGAALIGGLLAKATEDTIYQMQVDIVIREKAKGPVYASNSNVAGQSSVKDSNKSGFINSFGGKAKDVNATGQLNSNMANAQTQSFEADYIEHKTMMFAEATKMNLTLDEATPILEKQISNQISGLF
ncbi:complement resistance protein TraT [Aliarcobacter lanthieri]|uniref:complement resistance protein TraT n=1 Tax=Arcobacteraceae TaxID=2808963 RepID=UPI000DE9FA20|nr:MULTISPECIES: complement resistance protein TraT [Arcobacteraceae]MBL3521026.1 complement resistance protein TraT [Aliarcobacter lanthieri]RBQ27237.1 conjugal transfer protein TraT [Arcobacter sp. CECT 9188]